MKKLLIVSGHFPKRIASAYIGGFFGAYVTREVFGKGWWVPVGVFVGFSLVLAFLQKYVFWPHMWPVIEKTLEELKKALVVFQGEN